ncbi:MAG TPA: hypothetical protein VGA69_09110, partial [Nitriliruptorales bacterium]
MPFPAPEGVDAEILAPLRGLGPCPAAPTELAPEDPTSFSLPPAALLTSVERADPLTNVQGWLDWTPVQ